MTVHRRSGRDFYAELGLTGTSSAEDVRRAYRRLALELHPDRNPDPAALGRFRDVAAAYAVLSDPVRRADYDTTRGVGQVADADPAAADPPAPGGVDYVPAGPAVAYTDYVPTSAESWTPPTPPPPQPAPGPGHVATSPGAWPPGWPVGRIDPRRGLGPVLLAAWRIAPLPCSRSGKAAAVAGVAFVYWVAGPAALALVPAGPRPWVALALLLIVWAVAVCWVLRTLTWAWFALIDATHRATVRLGRAGGGNRPRPSTSGPRPGKGH